MWPARTPHSTPGPLPFVTTVARILRFYDLVFLSFSLSLPPSPFRTGPDDADDGTQWLQQCLTLDAVCTAAWVGAKRALKVCTLLVTQRSPKAAAA